MINPFSFISSNIKSRFSKENAKKETKDEEEIVITKETENVNKENNDKSIPQFIDELATVPILTMDDFKTKYVEDHVYENQAELSDETDVLDFEEVTACKSDDKSMILQRRWKVALWDLSIENLTEEEVNIFIEIDFGTSRDEFRVQSESKEYILSNGQLKHRIRTPIIHKLTKEKPQKIKFQPSFEYRGSYFDLEKEKLKLSAWRYHNFRLNTLDAIYDTKLIECANSDLNCTCYLMKMVEGNKLEKAYIFNFNLYFQEIYDFQLSLDHWEIKSLMSFADVDKKLGIKNEKQIEKSSLNYSKIIDFEFSDQNSDCFSEMGEIRRLTNFSCENSYFFGNLLSEKKFNKNKEQIKKSFENIQLTYKKENDKDTDISDIEKNIKSEVSLKLENQNKQFDSNNRYNNQSIWKLFLKLLGIIKDEESENIMNLDSLLLESELDQAKIHPSDCCPKLKIKLIWPSPIKEYTIFSSIQRGTNWPIWESIGSIFLRGTIADLENSFLDVEVIDTNKDKSINLQAKTHIPLKGLIETSTVIESKLSEPLWLAEKVKNTDERRNFAAWEFGLITGNISFINYPKQRQKGNFVNFIKDRVYLMVKILKVDNIITLENIEDFQIHASITHQGLTSRSTTIYGNGSSNIVQDDYVVFPLQLPPISELYSFHLESLAEIYVDLWVSSKNNQFTKTEHAGYTSFTIWDTMYNIKGTKRPISDRFYICYASGTKERLKVRLLEQEMSLKFLFPTDRVSNITFEAFITPDILSIKPNNRQTICSKNNGIPEKIDIFLRSRLDLSPSQAPKLYSSDKITIQTALTGRLGTGIIGRFFLFSVFNHRGNELMLSQFINQMPIPNNIMTPNAIFHFVRCVPFINTSFRDPPKRYKDKFNNETKSIAAKRGSEEDTNSFTFKKTYYWFTPDFTLLNNGGGVVDHCLLHASLLLKIKIQAFVCIGTTNSGHFHAWVMSWHFNETENSTIVKFWELTTGQIYSLKNRFHNQQRAREVTLRFRKRERLLSNEGDQKDVSKVSLKMMKLPYKSIDTIFNEMNIWYNIQNVNPGSIFFDLWNNNLFLSCTNSPLIHQPGFRSQPYLSTPTKNSILSKKRLIKSVLNYEVQAHRTAQNLGTRWNRDPTLEIFLEKGLDLMEQSELSEEGEYQDICLKINNWKSALESKVPHMHRVLGFPLSFNHTNPKLISETILGKLEILFSRDKSFTVTISVVVYGYPNNTYCSRVFILVTQKISEREKKKILEQREKERFKNQEKLKRSSTDKVVLIKKESEILIKSNSTELNKESLSDSKRTQEISIEAEKKEDSNFSIVSNSQIITKDYIGILDKENRMIRKRRVTLPDGSVTGKLWISKKIKDDGNFRYYVDGIENSVSNCLNIEKSRVCATDLNYEGQRVGFAILPGLIDDPTPIDLMYEMALKIDDLLKFDRNFIEFTGGDAVLEWDYDKDEYFENQDENSDIDLEANEDEDEDYSDKSEFSNNEIENEANSLEGISISDNDEENGKYSEESKNEVTPASDYLDSESNSISSNEDEYSKRTICRPDSNSDTSDDVINEGKECFIGISEKFQEQETSDKNENININISSNLNTNKKSMKELKRFTKTGKYIIYRRPEYEQSKLKKRQELNFYDSNKDENLVFPVASLAMSLARGHSELRKSGLLNMGRMETNKEFLKDKNLIGESKHDDRATANSYSNDLFSKMFNNREIENSKY